MRVQIKPPTTVTTCFDFRDYLHTVALITTPGQANEVAADGDLVFVAADDNGLQIIDVQNRSAPELLGAVDTTGRALDVAWADSFVCVAYGETGLVIVDTRDPHAPRITGSAPTPGLARGVVVSDTLAYVADDVIGLMVFDIGDPGAPEPLGVENTPGKALDVAVAGPLAYVADEVLGLRVINVSDPQDPWLVSTVPIPGLAQAVFVAGGYAYVGARGAGVQVVDVSTAGSATIVGSIDTPGSALGVVVTERTLYVADADSGLRVAEISSPQEPAELNVVPSSSVSSGVAVSGDYVYVAEGRGGIRIIEAENPLPPPLIDRLVPAGAGSVTYIDAADSTVYGIASGVGLFIADLRDGAELETRGQIPLQFSEPAGLLVRDGFAYVPLGLNGVVIYDVSDPDSPAQHDYLSFLTGARGVDVVDDVIYFVTGGEQIGVYVLGGQDLPAYAQAVAAKTTAVAADSGYAFVTGEANELIVVNVENVAQPFVLGRFPIEGSGRDILIRDRYAYVVTGRTYYGGRSGVCIFNLQWPSAPMLVQFIETFGQAERVTVSDNTIYVAQGREGLEVIDISDPLNPEKIGAFGTDNAITDAAVTGGILFVAEGEAGVFATWTQECTSP